GSNSRHRNYVQAAHWFQRAAEQGDLRSVYYLGNFYSAGLGVPQDHLLACALLKAYDLMGGQKKDMEKYIKSAERTFLKKKLKVVNSLAKDLSIQGNFSSAFGNYVASLNR